MKNSNLSKVFHFNREGHSRTNPKLVRIQLHPEYTKVDFGYIAREIYYRGGWIKMASGSFLEVIETGKRYQLQLAENIPIAPIQHHFESKKDWRYYSLYYLPIPMQDCTINIIEVENGTLNDFNYYDIQLRMENGMEVLE